MNKKVLFLLAFFCLVVASPLLAQQAGGGKGDVAVLGLAIGAGIAIGVAAHGGGMGQGRAVSAALEGIARNPSASDKIFTPMIIGLALIESLVIYGLVIAFILQGKI
jgi:F-type H+-transporting ATPase subunit c